jgi:hypothetical protein
MHAPAKDKDDDGIDSLYEKAEWLFDAFHRHHMKMSLGELQGRRGEHIKNNHREGNCNVVTSVNCETSKM